MSRNLKNFFEQRKLGNDELLGRIRGVQRGRFDEFIDGDDEEVVPEKKEPEVVPLPEEPAAEAPKDDVVPETGNSDPE